MQTDGNKLQVRICLDERHYKNVAGEGKAWNHLCGCSTLGFQFFGNEIVSALVQCQEEAGHKRFLFKLQRWMPEHADRPADKSHLDHFVVLP